MSTRRHHRSRSPSISRSRSRSGSREFHSKSNRNDHNRHHSRQHSNKSYQHHSHKSSNNNNKSIIKSETNPKQEIIKKSVKFDSTVKQDPDNDTDKKEKKKEDFNRSGALKRDLETTINGIVVKYNEPPEGTLCTNRRWRLYVYKNDEQINLFYLHRKSFYLIGRDHRVTDILCRHISVSSQHAVIQYRRIKTDNGNIVKPYIMDLKSRHGTYLMGDKIESFRFYELLPKDKIQFGRSTREYIVLADDSIEKDLGDTKIEIKTDDNDKQKEQETYSIWSDDD